MKLQSPAEHKADTIIRRMRKNAVRVNGHNVSGLNPSSPVVSKHVSVKRDQTLVPPREVNIWSDGTYRTGDGDIFQQMRPGSMDAYKLPSRGLGV